MSGGGTITTEGTKLRGVGTAFTKTLAPGRTVITKRGSQSIASIESDTAATLRGGMAAEDGTSLDLGDATAYKVAPKLDQSAVFSHVVAALANNECVGIFPEGGSHDQAHMLPLKPGVALMALQFQAQHPTKTLRIIVAGLNYFHGHRFRSRVFVQFGEPLYVSQSAVLRFCAGGEAKREECNALLARVQRSLESVTTNAESREQLQVLWTVRRLYTESAKIERAKSDLGLKMKLTKKFLDAYKDIAERPDIKKLEADVLQYNEDVHSFGLRDHQVGTGWGVRVGGVGGGCV